MAMVTHSKILWILQIWLLESGEWFGWLLGNIQNQIPGMGSLTGEKKILLMKIFPNVPIGEEESSFNLSKMMSREGGIEMLDYLIWCQKQKILQMKLKLKNYRKNEWLYGEKL